MLCVSRLTVWVGNWPGFRLSREKRGKGYQTGSVMTTNNVNDVENRWWKNKESLECWILSERLWGRAWVVLLVKMWNGPLWHCASLPDEQSSWHDFLITSNQEENRRTEKINNWDPSVMSKTTQKEGIYSGFRQWSKGRSMPNLTCLSKTYNGEILFK